MDLETAFRPDIKKIVIQMTFVFCLLLFDGTFTSFFKDKNHKDVRKQEE
jgi:hypothetical protein